MLSDLAPLITADDTAARVIDWPVAPRLRTLSDTEAEALDRLARRRAPLRIIIGDRPALVSIEAVSPDPVPHPGATILEMRLRGEHCRLHLGDPAIAWLMQPLGLEEAITREAPDLRDLLIEYAALDAIEWIEEQSGSSVSLGSGPSEAPMVSASLRVDTDAAPFEVRLDLTPALADALAAFLDDYTPPAPVAMGALPVLLSIEAGRQNLTVAELAGLFPGDVVMMATTGPRATLPGGMAAELKGDDDGTFRLAEPFAAAPTRHEFIGKDRFMNARPQAGLDALPLTIVFEHGALTMTLAEIGALAPGAVLRLPPEKPQGVAMVCNGVQIGTGELVTIGEGTGVRVLTLDTGQAPRG